MERLGYVVLVQLFVQLCRQTDQEAALKKQYPPHPSYFYPGSVPRLDSPHLHRGATGGSALERESVAKSRQTGVCLNPRCHSKKKFPWPNASGSVSLQQSWATCLSELGRSKKRKERLNPCRHVQYLHTIFLCKT